MAWPGAVLRRSFESINPPELFACNAFSPLDTTKTTPFATIGGSGTFILREIQAGAAASFPSFSSTLKAMILPSGASPLVIGKAGAFEFNGPQPGRYSQRLP